MSFAGVVRGVVLAGLGYATAVIVASAVTIAFMTMPAVVQDFAQGTVAQVLNDAPAAILFGSVIAFPSALPGFLFTLFLAFQYRWRSWWPFAAAGAIDALIAHLIAGAYGGSLLPPEVVIASLPGGLAGGFAYWLGSGRLLARRDA